MDPITFIGPKQVSSVETLQEQYNGTIPLVKVTYEDGSTETMTQKLYEVSTSPAALDLTALRDQRLQPVVKSVLELLLAWGVGLADINFITQTIAMSINASVNTANDKLWEKSVNTLSLIDIDKVLKDKATLNDLIPPEGSEGGQSAATQA